MKKFLQFIYKNPLLMMGIVFAIWFSFNSATSFQKKYYRGLVIDMFLAAVGLVLILWMAYKKISLLESALTHHFFIDGTSIMSNTFSHPINTMIIGVTVMGPKKKKQIYCLLDTGMEGWLNVDKSVAEECGLIRSGTGTVSSLTHTIPSSFYRTDVIIGKSTFKNVHTISVDDRPLTKHDNQYVHGIIGIKLISQGKLQIEKEGEKFKYLFQI